LSFAQGSLKPLGAENFRNCAIQTLKGENGIKNKRS